MAELAALVSSDDDSVMALSPQPKGDIFCTDSKSSMDLKLFSGDSKECTVDDKSRSHHSNSSNSSPSIPEIKPFSTCIKPSSRSSNAFQNEFSNSKKSSTVSTEKVFASHSPNNKCSEDEAKISTKDEAPERKLRPGRKRPAERKIHLKVAVENKLGDQKVENILEESKKEEAEDRVQGRELRVRVSPKKETNSVVPEKKLIKSPPKNTIATVPAMLPKTSAKLAITTILAPAPTPPPAPSPTPSASLERPRMVVQPDHLGARKDFLASLEIKVSGTEPFLDVSIFPVLFSGFSLDLGRLLGCLDGLSTSQQHFLTQGWTVSHVSFPVARKILQLAGGGPKFLDNFLDRSKPRKSYIKMWEFQQKAQKEEEARYFRKTDLADCDQDEFKALFGLVSHEEADKIREKAKLSKRRMLRAQSDVQRNRIGPEDTGKFLKVRPNFLQVQPKKKPRPDEPLVTGTLDPQLAVISKETTSWPPPSIVPKPANSEDATESQSEPLDSASNSNTCSEAGDQQDVKAETFIVTQTREMKRKGIKLPRGWVIEGTKRESEARSHGQVYTYFRLDWTFQSPDGKKFRSLKTALAAARQQVRLTQWQTKPPPGSGRGEVGREYLAMAREEERQFDSDIYSLSGIRPVRKFPDSNDEKPDQVCRQKDSLPTQRMSAGKANPLTPAQYVLSQARGFRLSQVGEIEGPRAGGWFCSKLESLRHQGGPGRANPAEARRGVAITIFWETEETRGLNLYEYRQKLRRMDLADEDNQPDSEGKEEEKPNESELSEKPEEGAASVGRRMVRSLLLPPGWTQRLMVLDGEERREWIDPRGVKFRWVVKTNVHFTINLSYLLSGAWRWYCLIWS